MEKPDGRSPLEDLEARVSAAKERRDHPGGKGGRGKFATSGLGLGFRVAVDILAALAVGVGIGLLLDRWLGTTPWLLILFFILGSAAGIMNVLRVMGGYGYAVGYRKPGATEDKPGDPAKKD